MKTSDIRLMFGRATDRYSTPQSLYELLNAEFHFDCDSCPLDGTVDGLATLFYSWAGKRVWCNPPYGSKIGDWLERGMEADLAVFLLPARTDTRWFHDIAVPKAQEIRFLRGRVRFGGATSPAPFPSILVIFKKPH